MNCPRFALWSCLLVAGCAAGGGGASTPPAGTPSPTPPVNRAAAVIAEIEAHNAWLPADLRQEKYCKIAANPFRFFRGTNHLYWWDMRDDARLAPFSNTSTTTWLQSDLHIENFGSFDNDDGTVVYDLNDFDEGVIGDVQLDVWRLGVSMELALDAEGVPPESRAALINTMAADYASTMSALVVTPALQDQPAATSATPGVLGTFIADVTASESRTALLEKWTRLEDGLAELDLGYGKLEAADAGFVDALTGAWTAYLQTLSGGIGPDPSYFAILSVARRVGAGTGSYGTPRFYVLIDGATNSLDDNRILDVKMQREPSPYRFLPTEEQAVLDATFAQSAQRVAVVQKAMGVDVDDHLGWVVVGGESYSVREKLPFDEGMDIADLTPLELTEMAEHWGRITALAHARADSDYNAALVGHSVEVGVSTAIAERESAWSTRVSQISTEYAAQVRTDHAAFTDWLAAHTPGC